MTTVTAAGRGRGWGTPVYGARNPGNQTPSVSYEGDEWFKLISKLDLNDDEAIKSPTGPAANLINSRHPTDEDQAHLDKMLQAALDDRTFALKLIRIFENETNSRVPLMRGLQEMHEQKFSLYLTNPVRFYNMAYIFSEVYHRLRSLSGGLCFLALPLYQFYRMLLDMGGDEEIELAVTQLAINGKDLLEHNENQHCMRDISIFAREILTRRDLSTRSRTLLLLLIDLYHHKFVTLAGELQKFYLSQLGQETITKMQKDNGGVFAKVHTPQSPDTAFPETIHTPRGVMRRHITGIVNPKIRTDEINHPRDEPSEPPPSSAPRAIRGSGSKPTTTIIKDENKAPFKYPDESQYKSDFFEERVGKAYGHDDRFIKDY